jgi:hypothetical protein
MMPPRKVAFSFSNKSALFIYRVMLELHFGESSEKVIVTLNELITLTDPYYLFVFTHVTTKDVVSIIRSTAQDESLYPERYNQFDIDTTTVFEDRHPGEWHYNIYEQSDDTNTDVADTASLVEYGKMILYPATAYAPTKYNESTTYKVYNG